MVQPFYNRADVRMKKVRTVKVEDISYQPPFPVNTDNPLVYFDIAVNLEPVGRVVVELKADVCPRTAENMRSLCEYAVFKGMYFNRIFPGFMVQGGDYNKRDPWICPAEDPAECFDLSLVEFTEGGRSIYGEVFEDENFTLSNKLGAVSMVNRGQPNTNGSQFFFCTGENTHLDGENVVFGQVVDGFAAVCAIDKLSDPETGEPYQKVAVEGCGVLPAGSLGAVAAAAGGGVAARRAAASGMLRLQGAPRARRAASLGHQGAGRLGGWAAPLGTGHLKAVGLARARAAVAARGGGGGGRSLQVMTARAAAPMRSAAPALQFV